MTLISIASCFHDNVFRSPFLGVMTQGKNTVYHVQPSCIPKAGFGNRIKIEFECFHEPFASLHVRRNHFQFRHHRRRNRITRCKVPDPIAVPINNQKIIIPFSNIETQKIRMFIAPFQVTIKLLLRQLTVFKTVERRTIDHGCNLERQIFWSRIFGECLHRTFHQSSLSGNIHTNFADSHGRKIHSFRWFTISFDDCSRNVCPLAVSIFHLNRKIGGQMNIRPVGAGTFMTALDDGG